MSDGSTLTLAWGIQVDTIPLLLASQCYPAYHQAEIFFALVALRVRTSTLFFGPGHRAAASSFASSGASGRATPFLPSKVTSLILNELFWSLYADRDRWHTSETTWPEDVFEDEDRWAFKCDLEDMNFWHNLQYAEKGSTSQLIRTIRLFGLELLSLSARPLSWSESWKPIAVIGVSLAEHPQCPPSDPSLGFHESKVHHLPQHNLSRLSFVGDGDFFYARRLIASIGTLPLLAEKQRRAFERIVSVLRLVRVQGEVECGSKMGDVVEGTGQLTGEPQARSKVKRTRRVPEPSLMVVHKAWLDQ